MTDAFVLGAGLGTRLQPLTDDLPKPLVPIFQKPLITFAFDHLIDARIDRLVVNTHRLPERFRETFPELLYRGRRIVLVHEPVLLGTGGGFKNALPHLQADSFIVYSGDVLTDFKLAPLLEQHGRAGSEVTLALRQTRFKPSITLRGERVVAIGEAGDYDFANVSIWRRTAADLIPPGKSVSFIPTLQEMLTAGRNVGGVVVNDGKWFNIGSPNEYLEVHRMITTENWRPAYIEKTDEWPLALAASAQVDPTVSLSGFCSLGANSTVAAGAKLTDTILWPGAQIARASELRNCIVRAGKSAAGKLENAIV
jgi:mannose-1-phosphate guanylyltransferase